MQFIDIVLSESISKSCLLSISIVSYRSDPQRLRETLFSLALAVNEVKKSQVNSSQDGIDLYLVDNASDSQLKLLRTEAEMGETFRSFRNITLLSGHGNIGYGRGHNLAVQACSSRFHLILNPDVSVAPDALINATAFLEKHLEAGLLAPRILGARGEVQYLCRRHPTMTDLFARGFLPKSWRSLFDLRLARYEMRNEMDAANHSGSVYWDPPIISGCFMLFRSSLLKQLGGFDPDYFLYFEDYDLSLRAARLTRIAYVPEVCITHFGGDAARKGWLHIRLFLRSAWTFFGRHGWKFF